jgi:hypothetical protein
VETKEAREKPVKKRTRRKPVAESMRDVQYTIGVVSRIRPADESLGPTRSQAVPMATRANTAPETDAIPAFPMSVAVRERLSLMTGSRGGAAKVETKQQKKENQERWKARMCGLTAEKSQNSVALLSESNGILNFGTLLSCCTSREEPLFVAISSAVFRGN